MFDVNNNICKISCIRDYGFFSDVFEVIDTLYKAEKAKYNFDKFNVKDFGKLYSDYSTNSFTDFFDEKINSDIIIDCNHFNFTYNLDYSIKIDGLQTCNIYFKKEKIECVNKLINKYIHPKESINEKIYDFFDVNMQNKKNLGIHIRRTDHSIDSPFLDINSYFEEIDNCIDDYDNLFVMTDDYEILKIFKNKYTKSVFVDNVIRSKNGKALHTSNENNKHKIGEDVLIESCLLSKCDKVIITTSNVSMFAICKGMNEFVLLDEKLAHLKK